jgi:hypothetical protein
MTYVAMLLHQLKELIMDLMEIVRENANARKIIIDLNIAEIARKFGIKLADARKVQQYAFLLECQ